MSSEVKAIPKGYSTLTGSLVVKGAERAIEFYKRAFGATESYRLKTPDGKYIAHAEIRIGDSPLMLSDEGLSPDHQSAETLNGSPVGFFLYVEDVDSFFRRALEAGARQTMPVEKQFWGDRCGALVDPFGLQWMIGTHVEDVSPQEIEERAKKFFSEQAA